MNKEILFQIRLPPNQAVDGLYDTRFASGRDTDDCSVPPTGCDPVNEHAWLMIDLGASCTVCQIIITGRSASHLDRHGNLKVSFKS